MNGPQGRFFLPKPDALCTLMGRYAEQASQPLALPADVVVLSSRNGVRTKQNPLHLGGGRIFE